MQSRQSTKKSSDTKSRNPVFSIIVVTFNSADEIGDCLRSIVNQKGNLGAEIVVVDNGSRDDTAQVVRDDFPFVRLIETGANLGFAAANNLAYLQTRGDIVILVNPDSVLRSNALKATREYLETHPACGLCGGLLLDEHGNVSPSARQFPDPVKKILTLSGIAERFSNSRILGGGDYRWFDHASPMKVDWVPGAFTAIRRCLLKELGFFDERFFLYYEETDLCLRARRHGWEVHFVPSIVVEHEGGASSKKLDSEVFDVGGAQVMGFRMRAECLYHRKNSGLAAVLANIGIEWSWHQLRRIVNLGGSEARSRKRAYSKAIVRHLQEAVSDTSFGSICPPKPWGAKG